MSTPSSDPLPSSNPPPENALSPEQLAAESLAAGGKKRKNNDDEDEDPDVSGSLKDYGRAFLRLGDPFTPLGDIVQHGIFIETTEEIDYPKMSKKERKIFDYKTMSWEILWRMIGQSFREQMITLKKNRKLRRRLCAAIGSGMSGSRGEDANTLKKFVPDFINADPGVALDPPISKSSKVSRGYHHPVTARLLCPAKKSPTNETCEAILNGIIKVTGRMFLRFFYPDDWVYEEGGLMERLFEGHFMVRIAKCIMQGPSQALKAPGAHRGNRGNAAKIGARHITPRLMGYFGFQAVFSISSLETWQQVDGNFDYEQFYWMIVSLFDDGDNADILEKFNHHVFGDVSGHLTTNVPAAGEETSEGEDELEAYETLRAAKKARMEASASGLGTV
ncbi:hypothetical protein DFH08DRAFT_1073607 [Mycena albidolilacea]|uniref:Uncharacterized protein n=1 Tax=Mycena albidolilacea TaxID=1033008 RepID=A0AAD7ALR2_9AGAR|nr:hypothetical protein DFH08DRAFT_1073607 [Mycena albidolilacea]